MTEPSAGSNNRRNLWIVNLAVDYQPSPRPESSIEKTPQSTLSKLARIGRLKSLFNIHTKSRLVKAGTNG